MSNKMKKRNFKIVLKSLIVVIVFALLLTIIGALNNQKTETSWSLEENNAK